MKYFNNLKKAPETSFTTVRSEDKSQKNSVIASPAEGRGETMTEGGMFIFALNRPGLIGCKESKMLMKMFMNIRF